MADARHQATTRYSRLILLMFFGSGCAALMYEVIWLHLLRLIIGASSTSLGILLACFMGGMSLGSLLLPCFVSPKRHPLRVYAVIELLIGVIGLALVYLSTGTDEAYAWLASHGLAGTWAKILIAVACLLPPTMLMGATLPAIARWVKADTQGAARLGYYYGANIIGAVCGCLLVGFVLLQYYDVLVATYAAVSLNLVIAVLALGLSNYTSASSTASDEPADDKSPAHDQDHPAPVPLAWVCLIAGISGCAALGSEVVWTRLLSLILGGTVYTFAVILAVFLAALGLGGAFGSMLVTRTRRPMVMLGIFQFMAVLTIIRASTNFHMSYGVSPLMGSLFTNYFPDGPSDVLRCIWVVAPSAFCWGASFPLAIAAILKPGQDTGRSVGTLGAVNTFGAILGALGTTFWIIPTYGTQSAQYALACISIVASVMALGYEVFHRMSLKQSQGSDKPNPLTGTAKLAVSMVLLTLICVICLKMIPPVSSQLLAHGKHNESFTRQGKVLYVSEGVHTPVVVKSYSIADEEVIALHISGKLVASTELVDMRMERMLGHIPSLLHPSPKNILIIGLGAGVTAGSFVVDPRVESITICEIEPRVYQATKQFFANENGDVLNDPRTTVVFDDARHYLATTDQKFDIISSDPIHPWVRGAASLYSKEFYELCHKRLNPGGIVTHWLPLTGMNVAAVKSETATFFNAFPRSTLWHTGDFPHQRHMIIVGSTDPKPINLDSAYQLIEQTPAFKQSLTRLKLDSPADLLALYTTQKSDLTPWLTDAQINRDWAMRLEYLAGKAYNTHDAEKIYKQINAYHKFPEDLFQGSAPLVQDLRERLDTAKNKDK